MDLNFDRLRKIYTEGGDAAIYKEKELLLQEFIDSLPEDKKLAAIDYDKKICGELLGLTPEQRLFKISKMIQGTLFDLTDAWLDLANKVQGTEEADKFIGRHKKGN